MSEHQLRMALGPAARAIGGAVLCAITLAACGERGRGARPDGGANAGAAPAESVGAAAQATPRASGDSTRAGAPETTTSAGAGAAAESAGARDIARAPRGNPTVPPPTAGSARVQPPRESPETTAPSPPLRDAYHQPPRDTVSQVVYTGWKQFNLNCARCHGEDATGTTIAPYLINSFQTGKVNFTEYWNVVHGSRMQKGMPNWSGIISDDNLKAIYEYLKERSEGKVHPGRPAVR